MLSQFPITRVALALALIDRVSGKATISRSFGANVNLEVNLRCGGVSAVGNKLRSVIEPMSYPEVKARLSRRLWTAPLVLSCSLFTMSLSGQDQQPSVNIPQLVAARQAAMAQAPALLNQAVKMLTSLGTIVVEDNKNYTLTERYTLVGDQANGSNLTAACNIMLAMDEHTETHKGPSADAKEFTHSVQLDLGFPVNVTVGSNDVTVYSAVRPPKILPESTTRFPNATQTLR